MLLWNGPTAAPNYDFFGNGQTSTHCGECYEVTGSSGKIVVMIVDVTDACDNLGDVGGS
jgi:hypothetical protein